MKLQVGHLTLIGASVSGKQTAIVIPQLGLTLDLGYLPEAAVGTHVIAISHGHQDHQGALPMHLRQRQMRKMSPVKPTYFLPRICHPLMTVLISAQQGLDQGLTELPSSDPGSIDLSSQVNLLVTDDFQAPHSPFKFKGKYWLSSFPTHHRVPSFGYLVTERRKKLKAEYQALPSREFGQLITQTPQDERDEKYFDFQTVNLLAYTGDTMLGPLTDRRATPMTEQIFGSEILILECTYLQDKTQQEAHDRGHTHVLDILEAHREGHLKCRHLVLFHFSNRYFDFRHNRDRNQPSGIEELLSGLNFREKIGPNPSSPV